MRRLTFGADSHSLGQRRRSLGSRRTAAACHELGSRGGANPYARDRRRSTRRGCFAQAVVDGGAEAGRRAAGPRRARRAPGRRPPAATRRGAGRRPSASGPGSSTSAARPRRRSSSTRAAAASAVAHQLDGRRRRVVRLQHARRPARARRALGHGHPAVADSASIVTRAVAQQRRRIGGAVDDGGLDPDRRTGRRRARRSTSAPRSARTWAAVVGLTLPKRLADGAARPPSNARSRALGQRVGRHPQPDRRPAAGHDVGHPPRALDEQRERARPVGVGQAPGGGRHRRRPAVQSVSVGQVDDERVAAGPALHGEDPLDGGRAGWRRRPGRRRSRWGRPPARRPAAARPPRRCPASRPPPSSRQGVQELQCGVDEGERLGRGEVVDTLQRDQLGIGQGLDQRIGRAGEVLVARAPPAPGR